MPSNAAETHVAIPGLTPQEAEARLDRFGPNEPAATQHHSALSDLLRESMNPLVLILVIAAAASALLGQAVDAGIIGAIVLLSAAIDLAQTYRSQREIEQLRERVAPTATVLRGGARKEIQRRYVVPYLLLVEAAKRRLLRGATKENPTKLGDTVVTTT